MTDWVAVSVDLHDDAKVAQFAAALAVPQDSAGMRLVQLWGRMARHELEDGNVAGVTDELLETWAGWRGAHGLFAQEFRARFTRDGVVNGWWEWNGRHLRKARLDREYQANRRRVEDGSPDVRTTVGRESSGSTGTGTSPNPPLTTTTPREARPAVQVAVAANTGLRANTALAGFNELLPQQAEQPVADWMADGIPLERICEVVQERARRFKPGPGRTQPTTFTYFDKPVREAHARAVGREQMQSAGATPKPTNVLKLPRLA